MRLAILVTLNLEKIIRLTAVGLTYKNVLIYRFFSLKAEAALILLVFLLNNK